MATKTNYYFTLTYSARDADSGDTEMDLSINFENPKSATEIAEKIASWLTAAGRVDVILELQKK